MKIGFRFQGPGGLCHRARNYRTTVLIALSIIFLAGTLIQRSYADVENVRWVSAGHDDGFQVEFDGDSQYHIETLDEGRRVRIVLEDTELKSDVSDIAGRGRVVGIFPVESQEENAVYIDVLLDSPGDVLVETNELGLQVYPPDSSVAMTAMARDSVESDEQANTLSEEITNDANSADVVPISDVSVISQKTAASEDIASNDVPAVRPPHLDDDVAVTDKISPAVKDSTLLPSPHSPDAEAAQAGDSDVDRAIADSATGDSTTDNPNVVQQLANSDDSSNADLAATTDRQDLVEARPNTDAPGPLYDPRKTVAGNVKGISTAPDASEEFVSTSDAEKLVAESAPSPEQPVEADDRAESEPIVVATADVVNSAASTMRAAAVTMVAANSSVAAGEELAITGIRFSPLSGGRVQVNVATDGRPLEPGTFATNKPARLALDFFGAKIGFEDRNIKVGSGALESIIAIQTKDRVRLVLNLIRAVGYETVIEDNGIIIILDAPTANEVSTTSMRSRMFPEKSDAEPKHSINKVDFRRDKDGGGRIIVELSDPKAGIDVKEKSGELVVDFVDTGLPAELERRLDVVDFATPVQTIDTFRQGEHTRMVITPSGRFRQLAYQSGNVFSLTVSPLTEQEIEEQSKDEFGYSGEKLSLNFQKISVRAALQVIADFTGLNFVTSDSVKGSLTLRLQDVPWDQALDIILQTKGLGMRQKGNVVWVAPATEIAAKERQQLEASRQVAELEPLASELIQINYAKAEDIAELLKSIEPVQTGVETGAFGSVSLDSVETESNTLLSPRGQVTIDERTNSLLIQDTPSKITEIRKLISKLDRPVRQVLIETRIVEASDNFSRVLGARLGFARQSENTRFPGSRGSNLGIVTMSGNVEDVTTINNEGFTTTNNDGLAVNLPARGIGAETAGSFAISVEKVASGMWNLLNLELSALEASGDGKIIASPKIMTANQQEAIIKQGQERVFPPSGFNTKPTRDEAVLLLQVKPQITPDDRLVLDVRVKQDVFVDTTINVKDKKEVQTQVLLENGETVVIGGIYQEQTRSDMNKIPLLGDIPLLGNLFKRKGSDQGRQELLVFLTPRILDNTISLR